MDRSPKNKYEITLLSTYCVGESSSGVPQYVHDSITIEDSASLNQWAEYLQTIKVVEFQQVLLDKTDIVHATAYTRGNYRMVDLGRRETVLLVVANIVSIKRAIA